MSWCLEFMILLVLLFFVCVPLFGMFSQSSMSSQSTSSQSPASSQPLVASQNEDLAAAGSQPSGRKRRADPTYVLELGTAIAAISDELKTANSTLEDKGVLLRLMKKELQEKITCGNADPAVCQALRLCIADQEQLLQPYRATVASCTEALMGGKGLLQTASMYGLYSENFEVNFAGVSEFVWLCICVTSMFARS